MMWGGWDGGWFPFWAFGLHGLGMVVFWGLVIWAIVYVVRAATARPAAPEPPGADRALAVLRERYARGEMDEATFRRMRDELA